MTTKLLQAYLLILLMTVSSIPASVLDKISIKPMHVGTGPLFFFVHPEEKQKSSDAGAEVEKLQVLYAYDPTRSEKPHQLWNGEGNGPVPLKRITPTVVVMKYENIAFLCDLESGVLTPLLDNDDEIEPIAIEGSKVFFLRRLIPFQMDSLRFKDGGNDKSVVNSFFKPRDQIYVFDAKKGLPSKPLAEIAVERVLEVNEDGIWVITRDEPRKLAKVSRSGKVEEIIAFDSHWVTIVTRHEFSPERNFLAFSILHDHQDFHSERNMVIVNLKKKEICYSQQTFVVEMGGGSAQIPLLWLDDRTLAYYNLKEKRTEFPDFYNEQMWKIIDVKEKTSSTDVAVYKRLKKTFHPPLAMERRGYFDIDFDRNAFFIGEKQPVASVIDKRSTYGSSSGDLAVSPDGAWIAYCDPADKNFYVVDGARHKKSLLIPGGGFVVTWLPWEPNPSQTSKTSRDPYPRW